jgi:hypothetical protein
MRPIQANSDFYQNRSKSDASVTLTIHNPNGGPMNILDAPKGAVITTLAAGDTVTATFAVKSGAVLHSDMPGAVQYHGIVF